MKLYERVDISKILMMRFAFDFGYEYCVVMDVFKNHAVRVPDIVWDVAYICGIVYGARLENWAYVAHKDAAAMITTFIESFNVENPLFKKDYDEWHDYIYSEGPKFMSGGFKEQHMQRYEHIRADEQTNKVEYIPL